MRIGASYAPLSTTLRKEKQVIYRNMSNSSSSILVATCTGESRIYCCPAYLSFKRFSVLCMSCILTVTVFFFLQHSVIGDPRQYKTMLKAKCCDAQTVLLLSNHLGNGDDDAILAFFALEQVV